MTENNIKYALEDVERNRKDTMKMCEAVKKSNDWHPKKNRLLKHDKDLPQMKKKKQPEIIAKYYSHHQK